MFTFQTTGRIIGISSSRDNKTAYLKMLSDPVAGVDFQEDETPDTLDIACDVNLVPPGTGLSTRVAVEGSGSHAAREWLDRSKPGAKPKIIHNLRLQVRAIKLVK